MKTLTSLLAVAAGSVLLNSGPSIAQDAAASNSPALAGVVACRAVPDAAQRLACFDAAADALVEAESRGDVIVIDRAEAVTARRQMFGFELPSISNLFAGPTPEAEVEAIETTLTEAVSNGPNGYTFRLADGTVWTQVSGAGAYVQTRPGSPVRVRRASMGSYLLVVGRSTPVQVRRR